MNLKGLYESLLILKPRPCLIGGIIFDIKNLNKREQIKGSARALIRIKDELE